MTDKNFYRAFEEKHRGTRELIKSRLKVYLPFVLPFKEIYDKCNVLDIGCGRGEWLELMGENEFSAIGVDFDDGMLEACKELALNAINKDALLALKKLPNESQVVVSGFHVAEHLPFKVLLDVVKESIRVLKPGGLLILETPNAENIYVGTLGFYTDPTHLRPIYSELLIFMMEYCGYNRNKILRLQEAPELHQRKITLSDVYGGASPDYAIIAQKEANQDILSLFDDAFTKDYGLSINSLCNRFEKQIEDNFISVETKTQNAETIAQYAVTKAQNAETRAQSAETMAQYAVTKAQISESALNAIYTSRSWKMTAPYRAIGNFLRGTKQKIKNTLKPYTAKCITFIKARPMLKKHTVATLNHFPKIETRLRSFYDGYYIRNNIKCSSSVNTKDTSSLPLTPEAVKIYIKLNRGFKNKKDPE
ncbi:MAG: class I SAM-dependent methyltransferase [Synergistaceae bacterium]|nr:class I SAM-dependent methyltransferase [Synergistaceae bacterium]